ncbi:MAG TPA: 4-hydroxy-3-methylbut-2-enyl diphosphate reductase [Mycobacteriales bacterium]|nr:4-hydroxy-3-methylbut-2-enyl diphosphate reductase [Mycobacteriales bacterium]
MGDELTICTPMRVEQAAVLAGLRGARAAGAAVRVVRTGMGPRRTRERLALAAGDGPLVVLGIAGGLAAHVLPGDVVVASEVRADDVTVACPAAPVLVGALRDAGFRVHVGPIISSSVIVEGAARAELAASDALAVDMESAWLLAGHPDRPAAVVRVITDTAEAPLLHFGVVQRIAGGLAALRRIAPVVADWGRAVGAREVMLASPRSFCAGVERAIEIVRRALERYGPPVYVRRQIVHNAHVVADLERRGAVFVDEVDQVPAGARLVLAAHGVAPVVRQQAADRGLDVVDATCPLVAKVHQEVRRYAGADHTVVLIGHGDHEEVVGSAGEAPGQVRIVADEAAAEAVEVADPDRVAYVMQTTLAVDEAERVAAVLRRRFPKMRAPRHDDICYATSNRQQAVREIATGCDVVLVVGSANSSNSQRLVEVARRAGAASYLVDDATGIRPRWLAGARRVGVTAGASAPPELVDGVVTALSGLGPVRLTEHRAVDEDVRFGLPKEVS